MKNLELKQQLVFCEKYKIDANQLLLLEIILIAQEGDDAWEIYDGWQKESLNTDRVSSNRTLQVEGGYYYRVRCTHAANSDVSSSFTNGVYVE